MRRRLLLRHVIRCPSSRELPRPKYITISASNYSHESHFSRSLPFALNIHPVNSRRAYLFFSLIHDGRLSPFAPVYAFCFTRRTLHAFVLSFLSKSDVAKLATLHAFQCKRITPTPANAPISSGTHPLNNSKWAKMARHGLHAPEMVLTRNRPAHTSRTPTHTRDAHAPARHARQRTHTHTPARTSACTHTHARTCTRTQAGARAHAHARTRAHAGAPAPAHTRDPELAALRARLQVRCKRAISDVNRSERDGVCGFA